MVPSVASGAFLVPNHARSPRSTLDGIRTSENTILIPNCGHLAGQKDAISGHLPDTVRRSPGPSEARPGPSERKGRAAVDTIW
jgi:hypothetical protein